MGLKCLIVRLALKLRFSEFRPSLPLSWTNTSNLSKIAVQRAPTKLDVERAQAIYEIRGAN